MATFLENYGLECFCDSEESFRNLISYVVQEGKTVTGYYDCPHVFLPAGNPEFWISTSQGEDGKYAVDKINTHSGNLNIWKVASTGMDVSSKDMPKTQRTYMFKNAADGKGLFPIEIITADVLPSYLENEVIQVQVEALPLDIFYYKDEDDYAAHQPKTKRGKTFMVAPGSLFPGAFLSNHNADRSEEEKDYDTDSHVVFAGKVKALYHGVFEVGENKDRTYIRCIIDTQFGELEIAHTYDQVPEELRENIRVGSIVFGVCIISGDVALYDYENGFIKDHEHNLKLLRDVFAVGEEERLNSVLSEVAEYLSAVSGKCLQGPDDIIDWMVYVRENKKSKCYTHLATITEIDDEDVEFPAGTRCIVLAYEEKHKYESIVFITLDDENMIRQIQISADPRYHFKIDEPSWEMDPDDFPRPSEDIEPQMVTRAKISLEIMDEDFEQDALYDDRSAIEHYRENADNFIGILQNFSPEENENAIRNLFGYLFAKAVEVQWNDENGDTNMNPRLIASYSVPDAFSGSICSTLPGDVHQKLVKAMEIGQKFFLDYKSFIDFRQIPEEEYPDVLKRALVATQQIGKLCYKEALEEDGEN